MKIIKPGKFNYQWTDSERDNFDNANLEYMKSDKKVDIIFYGDSITACWPINNYFSSEINVINRAIGGDRTRYMLYRFDADCIQFYPKKVVFLGGINDVRAWSKREDYFSNMNEINMIEEITNNIFSMARKCKANGIEFIISSILPTNEENMDNLLINQKIIEINKILNKHCLDEKLEFIDYYKEFVLENSIYVDKKKTLDGLHPNEDGYEIMKKILFKGIGDYNEN